ncbi:MAG: helicase [Gammaproteobacteria bacterium]|nr:MAG: helicase [Gammaproteobacteria bacterium]
MLENNPNLRNREKLIHALKAELVGPNPVGEEIDCSGEIIVVKEKKDLFRPWRQKGTGEEILTLDSPCGRYGVGVLYPRGVAIENGDDAPENGPGEDAGYEEEGEDRITVPRVYETEGAELEPDALDFDLSLANSYRPSSMAISFLTRFPENARLNIQVTGGRYFRKEVRTEDVTENGDREKKEDVGNNEKSENAGDNGKREEKDQEEAGLKYKKHWWLRLPVRMDFSIAAGKLLGNGRQRLCPRPSESVNTEDLDLSMEVFSRPTGNPRERLITVSLVNRSSKTNNYDDSCLFQTHFTATVETPDGNAHILPYPVTERTSADGKDDEETRLAREEEESLDLLYRNRCTWAVGHGCAANWLYNWLHGKSAGFAKQVSAEPLPVVEVPSITPDIRRPDGTDLRVPMASLAGLVEGDDGFEALEEVVRLYSKWIDEREAEIDDLPGKYRSTARRHIARARSCAARMRDGITFLGQDAHALNAFRLANHAILLQQARDSREPREAKYDSRQHRLSFSRPYAPVDLSGLPDTRGYWRAFQIAFLLMTLRSTVEGKDPDRENVELIWFPTGGGKTEAYLGLAAFAIFYRYLRNPQDHGCHVLMRYTLRLLTAQQFQRASRLICAMEYLRRKEDVLAKVSRNFSIGIWLGSNTTPNTRKDAIALLRDLEKPGRKDENRFLVTRCPWCNAQMGPLRITRSKQLVPGYERGENTVVLKCPDPDCEFHRGLPVYVIDEDIYEYRPDLIIGTVDKFAMLAWRPQARAIFGLDPDGKRFVSPPGLIIQDELHLISGPLGSMVGLYEPLIEALCTDNRTDPPLQPKIVSSTATIRRYESQIRSLYGRNRTTLFPPPGLDSSDSFFARYATDEQGTLLPGRKYVGVHVPGIGSFQTAQVRVFSALLMASVPLEKEERDPWWTLLAFFNSLRELGGALSLFQSDIPEYMNGIRKRDGLEQRRFLNTILELTGRISGQEVPEAISRLEAPTTGSRPAVDVCLASNIIEVGVDIDRLSLMGVVGQPKTTSQYIQVTGRVGRRWWERPGLVVTLYSASKPRDRSHFEKFRSYHERLYAQVEPTSVTPFSPPALDRALHAVMIAYVRQFGGMLLQPWPVPCDLLENLKALLLPRISRSEPEERENFIDVFNRRISQWKRWERASWETSDANPGLMYPAGEYVPDEFRNISWPVPMSMRNVDAECVLKIKLPDPEQLSHE